MTNVLVVDDSRFMRTIVGNALETAGFDVETAADGAEAVEAAAATSPDVVTMDVEMPEMGGIEAVERIMRTNPTSILMLSAYTDRGTEATLDALERGAVDFLHKPDGSGSRNLADLSDAVVEKVTELADADVSSLALARAAAAVNATGADRRKRRVPASAGATTPSEPATARVVEPAMDDPTVIVGASTGGPKIIEQLFAELPPALSAKVVVVQHMPADFTDRFAERLDAIGEYDVREAEDGDRLASGEAVVAPGGHHLRVTNNVDGALRLRLDDGPRVHGVKPAIDVTMETAAEAVSDPLTGVVLTGMGKDGAAGIEAIKNAGGRTIAQDESTSPVFGIPCQAIETGCVDRVLPAGSLVEGIVDSFGGEINE